MSLTTILRDPRRFVWLYGTTPTRADVPEAKMHFAAERLGNRARKLQIDGVVVYDIQDETGRTDAERPFPFLPTRESREYARLVRELSGRETICYKCVRNETPQSWRDWLDSAAEEPGFSCLSLVGQPTSRRPETGMSLGDAMAEAKGHAGLFTLGGVAIPERHSPERSESQRLLEKAERGCEYFVSQAIYSPRVTARLLRDYAADCARTGLAPKRIVLTFTPCGNERTLAFMKWLGIAVSEEAERRLETAENKLEESLNICAENLTRVLEEAGDTGVPLGVNVESVSIRKDEIAASVELVQRLKEVTRGFGIAE